MTGLLLKELILRGDADRCLIVCPGSLAEQWQDELWEKFHLHFEILTNDRIESAVTGNVFTEMPHCIARLDKLARNDALQERLKATDWDIIIVDEAKSVFPTDDSLFKMLYLAMMDITKKWNGRRQDWSRIHAQLSVYFADRMPD